MVFTRQYDRELIWKFKKVTQMSMFTLVWKLGCREHPYKITTWYRKSYHIHKVQHVHPSAQAMTIPLRHKGMRRMGWGVKIGYIHITVLSEFAASNGEYNISSNQANIVYYNKFTVFRCFTIKGRILFLSYFVAESLSLFNETIMTQVLFVFLWVPGIGFHVWLTSRGIINCSLSCVSDCPTVPRVAIEGSLIKNNVEKSLFTHNSLFFKV